jgi:hypothetical protein
MGLMGSFSFTDAVLFGGMLSKIVPNVDKEVDAAAQEIIDLCNTEVKKNLYPGHGLLTGNLRDSLDGTFTKSGSSIVNIDYGTDVYYAIFVEMRWGGAYAFFFPGLMLVEPQIPIILKRHIDSALGL